MNKVFTITIVIALCANLLGCEFAGGIRHEDSDSHLPAPACIKKSVLAIPGISGFEYHNNLNGNSNTNPDTERRKYVQVYSYKYAGLKVALYFIETNKGKVEYHQDYAFVNYVPPQKDIDLIRPVMFKVEQEIENKCGIPSFTSQIKEHCIGVKCD